MWLSITVVFGPSAQLLFCMMLHSATSSAVNLCPVAATQSMLFRCRLQAHYLLGVAQREIGQLSEGISHLSKALEQAREKGDSIKDEIWRELARAKYQQWQQDSQARTATVAALKQQLQSMLQAQRLQGEVAGAAAGCGPGGDFKGSPEQQQQAAMQQWEELLQRAAHLDSRTEVPTAFTCPLTMEVGQRAPSPR